MDLATPAAGRHIRETIESSTQALTYTGKMLRKRLGGFKYLVLTLNVIAAERDSGDETYDCYIVMGDGVSTWDIVHFPQIVTTGAKQFTARVSAERFAEVTTASAGVASEPSATLLTSSTNGAKSLGAGVVRHGPFADQIGVIMVIAGTIVTGINFTVEMTAGG